MRESGVYGGESGLEKKKNGMGCSEGECGVSVENTKPLSGGEQMSDCRCAFFDRTHWHWGGASVGTLWLSGEKSEIGQLCHIFYPGSRLI